MKNKSAKSPVRNYYVSMVLFAILLYTVAIPIMLFAKQLWLKALAILLAFLLVKFVNSYLGVKNFISILIVEKDGDKFSSVLKPSKYFSPSAQYRALGSYYGGNHAETVNVCAKAIKSGEGRNREYFFAEKLALTYFELGDDEKLRAALGYFNLYTVASKKGEAIRRQFGYMKFLEAYLAGDIYACEKAIEDCAETYKRQYANIYEAQKNCLFAIACFRLGEKERAKALFETVISDAPKTHFARIAQKHLDACAENAYALVNPEIVPDEDFEIYGKKMRAYLQIRKPVLFTALTVLVIIILTLH